MAEVIDFYDNSSWYTPPCCRPGGRCTVSNADAAIVGPGLENAAMELVNRGASVRDLVAFLAGRRESQ